MITTRYVFGAGKMGNQVVEILKRLQLKVAYIFDNDEKKWGTDILGVSIIGFEKQYLLKEGSLIYVACVDYQRIVDQMKREGIPDKKIIIVDSIFADNFLRDIACHIISLIKTEVLDETLQYDVLFDLSGGMVLGGVERWNYGLAEKLKERKISASYFVVTNKDCKMEDMTYPSININEAADIISYVKKIVEVSPKVIVCNFPFSIMKAACIVKHYYNRDLKIIAIIHSDLNLYYRTYEFWEKDIDVCIGISAKIEKMIKSNQRLSHKFMRLHWKTNILLSKKHIYSKGREAIRIGYAGRIVEYPKRLDRMIPIAKDLVKRDVNFRIQIAGDGAYRTELEDRIQKNDLRSYFQFLGQLDHDRMQEFWENQDIYLNCSDYEGHSIAQAEAMASGAVPVMMDVSGAQDDIENGENGFVTPVGDVKAMAKKIDWLYRNRNLLPVMGEKSRRKIETNNKLADDDLEILINEIMKAVV